MEKLLAMHVAAQLTQAACGNAGAAVPVDPELKNDVVRAKNLHVWETFRGFYRGVAGALADTASWPNPSIDGSRLLPGLLQTLTPLLKDSPLSDVLQRLLTVIPTPLSAPRGPLPDPGAPASK